jgi:hypothetical protein
VELLPEKVLLVPEALDEIVDLVKEMGRVVEEEGAEFLAELVLDWFVRVMFFLFFAAEIFVDWSFLASRRAIGMLWMRRRRNRSRRSCWFLLLKRSFCCRSCRSCC